MRVDYIKEISTLCKISLLFHVFQIIHNPPYMGAKKMSAKLVEYTRFHYPKTKADLFAVFIERVMDMVKKHGYQAMITQHAWMFIDSFYVLRERILDRVLINMAHLGTHAFEEIGGEVVQTTAFVLGNYYIEEYIGKYKKLVNYTTQELKEKAFLSPGNIYEIKQKCYSFISEKQIAYWLGENILKLFAEKKISDFADACYGFITGDNDKYLKYWYEVQFCMICFSSHNDDEFKKSGAIFAPCNKGGEYHKWYGNNDYIAMWSRSSEFHRNGSTYQYAFFQKGITWSVLSSNGFNGRYYDNGYVFDHAAASLFVKEENDINYILGYLNSTVFNELINALNPTINTGAEIVAKTPIVISDKIKAIVNDIVCSNIEYSKDDWDSFETSWDFQRHPLVPHLYMSNESSFRVQKGMSRNYITTNLHISKCFEDWKALCQKRFDNLKLNEEKLNSIFIDVYNLHDEIKPEVDEKAVTVRKADINQDIRTFISYAVGCMFGRYSLDIPGLAYGGGMWDSNQYISFIPKSDNCIPITDEEYYEDDIVGRFVEFVKVVYGMETLEENLEFISEALGNKGRTSREIIRYYFLNDYYKDHLKIYRKRPIYWLFDSGRQNGFKVLVYMHRWNSDTAGHLRIEYLHKLQMIYEHEIETCQDIIAHESGKELILASKRKEKLMRQLKECKNYDALLAHIALSHIDIDLKDGVKFNFQKVQTGADGVFCNILAESKNVIGK